MPHPLRDFSSCISEARATGHIHALLGNGFSRACRDDIFAYGALFDRATFSRLSPNCRAVFDSLNTTDFEVVIRALKSAAFVLETYDAEQTALTELLRADADGLREVLVAAIADSHPDWPGEIAPEKFAACKQFLSNFERIYTLNYDLLLYWAFMQEELFPALDCDDGFRRPESGQEEYVTWEVENSYNQKIYYLHGALHLFDSGPELQKFTWKNTGIRLKDQVRAALANSKYPLFVSEGTSREKLERIKHSGYLHRGLVSMPKVSGSMFVYGLSFASNDDHVLHMLEIGKISHLYVGIYGDPSTPHSQQIIARSNRLVEARRTRFAGRRNTNNLEVHFYSAESANLWG